MHALNRIYIYIYIQLYRKLSSLLNTLVGLTKKVIMLFEEERFQIGFEGGETCGITQRFGEGIPGHRSYVWKNTLSTQCGHRQLMQVWWYMVTTFPASQCGTTVRCLSFRKVGEDCREDGVHLSKQWQYLLYRAIHGGTDWDLSFPLGVGYRIITRHGSLDS